MRRCVTILFVCLLGGLDIQAGAEYPAKPGEEVVANEFIVHLMPGATATTLIAKYLAGAQVYALRHDGFFRIKVPGGLPSGISARIAADLQVDFVEPNRVRHAVVAAPNDPNYASSWWFPAIQALQAWSLLPGQYLTAATAGTGRVKVAVLDTGADCTHPDFMNTGGTSTDSAQGGQLMFSASQALVQTTIVNPVCAWQDDHGHGTHVTGILAAATSNGIGVSGLGYPVQVMEYKVLDSAGSGSDAVIMSAIEAAADAGAQVVSLSLGGTGYSSTLQAAVNYAWQRNTLVVAAAGNDAKNELFFPASANHAVGVSATNSGNNLASFSNFGNSVQLAAPGVGILSTAPSYSGTSQGWLNYVSLSGTSMATPFVSGLAGLVAMTTPNATAAAILQRMEQTAASATTGGGWGQNFGFGIIDASSAVSGALRSAANGAITGQIVNTAGSPLGGGQITINSQTITTDTTGLYRFATLPAGTYPVTVSAPGKPTQSLTATVAPGADTSFTVTMGVTYGKFTGTIADQGLGVPGAIVQALSGGLITAVAIADQAGQFTLWVPGSGTYDVRASQIGRVTTTLTALTLSTGGTTTANLTLPRMGTIAGSVRDGSSNPVANAQVLVTGGTFSAAGTTDAGGNYSLIGVPTGSPYSATATATGFVSSTQNGIAVSADVTTSLNFTMSVSGNSAVFVKTDTTTQGSWKGVYGANGYNVIDDTVSYPGYVTVTPAGPSNYVWAGSTSDVRGLQKALSSTDRLAATWYSSGSYTIDLNFNDGAQHRLAVYCLDWDFGGARAETLSILDGGNNAMLSTQTVSNFQNGKYVVWNLTGHVVLKVTNAGGDNAVISGLFFDPLVSGTTVATPTFNPPAGTYGSAQSVTISTTTPGASIRYTTDGSTPSSVLGTIYTVPVSVSSNLTLKAVAYMAGMADSAVASSAYAIQAATPTFNPPAGTYGSGQSVTISTTTPGASIRYTTDGSTPSSVLGTLYTVPVSVSSNLTLKAVAYGTGMADSAVASASYTISGGAGSNTAVFVKTDATTQGTWKGVYGGQGYNVIDDTVSYPGYVTVTPAGPSNYVWAGSTSDVRGLQKALSSTDRLAATWYTSGSYTIDLNFNDGAQHQLAVYCLDWDSGGRTEALSILDGSNNAVLNTQTVSNFQNGKYVVWDLTGHVVLKVTYVGGYNAVISGLFFDPLVSGTTVATPTFNPPAGTYGSAQSVTISTTTPGASIRYTTDGSTPSSVLGTIYTVPVSVSSNLMLKAVAYMAGMADSAVASSAYAIQAATPTFNPPAGTYGSGQSVTISTTTPGASIRYTTDGSTPSSVLGTLYTVPVSVSSNLTLKAVAYGTGMADSAVASASYTISGGAGSNTAVFVKTDATTQGTWKGVYGGQGYNVIDDTVSYPGYVTVTPAGPLNYVWAGSTSDVRGLQKALSSTDRLAATWYTSGSYTIDLNFNDGAQHQLAVYCLDWDFGGTRTQTVSILDGSNNAVLSTQTVSNFQNGKYVVWNLTGHVVLKVTNAGGDNAVISGLFFN